MPNVRCGNAIPAVPCGSPRATSLRINRAIRPASPVQPSKAGGNLSRNTTVRAKSGVSANMSSYGIAKMVSPVLMAVVAISPNRPVVEDEPKVTLHVLVTSALLSVSISASIGEANSG